LQADADIGKGQRVTLPGLQGDLAVEHIDAAQLTQALQQLGRIQRRVILFGQPFKGPATLLVLAQNQLQATEFDARQAHFAGGQAGPQVRYHLDVIQAQGRCALAQLQVTHAQHRRQAAPAPFQRPDMHG